MEGQVASQWKRLNTRCATSSENLAWSRDDSRGCGDAAHTSTSYSCKMPVSFRYRLTNLPVTISFSVNLCIPDPRTCAIAQKSLGSNQSQDWNRLPTATVNIEDPESKKPKIRKYITYCTVLSAKIGNFSPQHQFHRRQWFCPRGGGVVHDPVGVHAWGCVAWGGRACPGGVSAGEGMRARGRACLGGVHAWGSCVACTLSWPDTTRYGRSMRRQYASYWNAFLFFVAITFSRNVDAFLRALLSVLRVLL